MSAEVVGACVGAFIVGWLVAPLVMDAWIHWTVERELRRRRESRQ